MSNKIKDLFAAKTGEILSLFFTAGFPKLNDTSTIIKELENSGADLVEIGIPFSDPLADGPTIQESSEVALANGISLNLIFEQLKDIRSTVGIPLILMGYFNPVLQFGMERFCGKCKEVGIDGVIFPDLPLKEYLDHYKDMFDEYDLKNILLITPQTSEERIREIDLQSDAFIYMVASNSTTGTKQVVNENHEAYFKRVNSMDLKNPLLIGFGITDRESFQKASNYASGAIIGSAFIKAINNSADLKENIREFITDIKS